MTAISSGSSISGGAGNDSLVGGVGNDTFYTTTPTTDTIVGGAGNDTLWVIQNNNSSSTAFAGNTGSYGPVADGLISGVEFIRLSGNGGSSNAQGTITVTLTGQTEAFDISAAAVAISVGNSGSTLFTPTTSITGGSGADTIVGSSLLDTIIGGDGADVITAGSGADVVDGGLGIDTYVIGRSSGVAPSATSITPVATLGLGTLSVVAGTTFTFANGVDRIAKNTAPAQTGVVSTQNAFDSTDLLDVTTAGVSPTNLIGTDGTLATGTTYVIYGTWNQATGVFTAAATYSSTATDIDALVVDGTTGSTVITTTGFVLLEDLTAALSGPNFI